jgi:hypothetical protein
VVEVKETILRGGSGYYEYLFGVFDLAYDDFFFLAFAAYRNRGLVPALIGVEVLVI